MNKTNPRLRAGAVGTSTSCRVVRSLLCCALSLAEGISKVNGQLSIG